MSCRLKNKKGTSFPITFAWVSSPRSFFLSYSKWKLKRDISLFLKIILADELHKQYDVISGFSAAWYSYFYVKLSKIHSIYLYLSFTWAFILVIFLLRITSSEISYPRINRGIQLIISRFIEVPSVTLCFIFSPIDTWNSSDLIALIWVL